MISFNASVPTFNPEPFPIAEKFLIAPFWADVDTRGTGEVYFKESTDQTLLTSGRKIILRDQETGLTGFRPRWLLIATWYRVGYFDNHSDLVIYLIVIQLAT